jgi:hypothetical protein
VALSEYQPGVCNIGGPEVARRKKVAQLGTAFFLALGGYLLITGSAASSAALALGPALLAAVGFVQSRKKFCFAFGLLGTFNFSELGKMSKVLSKEEIAADRRQALLIVAQSIGLALVGTLVLAALLSL